MKKLLVPDTGQASANVTLEDGMIAIDTGKKHDATDATAAGGA